MPNQPTKEIQCKICQKYFKKVSSNHLKFKHNISVKEYYDTYYKIKSEGICIVCKKETTFSNMNKGYLQHCSCKCVRNNILLVEQSSKKLKQTRKDNPEITIDATKKFKKTIEEKPEIIKNRVKSYKIWCKENPDKSKKRSQKGSETKYNTIDTDGKNIHQKTGKKRSQWTKENPELQRAINYKGAEVKRNDIDENGLNGLIRQGQKLSITKRKKFEELTKTNSTVSHFLYIIKHQIRPIIKIGRSEDPKRRLNWINNDFGKSEILYILEGPYNKIQPLESYLHDYFNEYCKVQPERKAGRTEWFDESILDNVMNIIKLT